MDKIEKPLKIVSIQLGSKSAGSSAMRLHEVFVEKGIDSSIISLKTDKVAYEKVHYVNKYARITAKIDTQIKKSVINKNNNRKKFGAYSYPLLGTDISRLKYIKQADIIYIHWILGGFLSLRNIRQIFRLNKPVIIIMHDMWWITGGCHYSFDCRKYEEGCYNCQILPQRIWIDLAKNQFIRKSELFSTFNNIHFVSPSKWLYDCAKKSLLTHEKPIFYIPNAIDNVIFKQIDKKIAKDFLNIKKDSFTIAFGAVNIESPYKGWSFLIEALQELAKEINTSNVNVLIFGNGYSAKIVNSIPFEINFLGFLQDTYSLVMAYNAADVFVAPSLADNQPTVIMESLCCGVPVVGFNCGGIPDMIAHKENGYLANYEDSKDLVRGIRYFMDNPKQVTILPKFNKQFIFEKHMSLLKSITGKPQKTGINNYE